MQLPPETLDEIASCIGLHRDLISFALASRACADLLIPRHTEYRVIRVRDRVPHIWAHLARRADLARNIRAVHICERYNLSSPDHYPTALLEKSADGIAGHAEEGQRITNLCKALRHMRYLEMFTWDWNVPRALPTIKPAHEDQILLTLNQKTTLKHLALSGRFGEHARGADPDLNNIAYPVCLVLRRLGISSHNVQFQLWKLSRLESLCLDGQSWVRPTNVPHICAMLKQSPELQVSHC